MNVKGRVLKFLSSKENLFNNYKDEYLQNLNFINVEELGSSFENFVLIKGLDVEKIKNRYKSEENIYDFPLKTKLRQEQSIDLCQRFFATIDKNLCMKVRNIFDENVQNIELEMDSQCKNVAFATKPEENTNNMKIYVPIRGDLRDVYSFVHEISHSFDIQNGDTNTRRILGEVLPQYMERCLDEFLANLSVEDKKKYGMDDKILKSDIQTRKITTFISRYDNIWALNRNRGNKEKNIRYMLAQIYQCQFLKINKNSREEKINKFIKCIENDEFEQANKTLGLKMNKENSFDRNLYINAAIDEFYQTIYPQNRKSFAKNKTLEEEQK